MKKKRIPWSEVTPVATRAATSAARPNHFIPQKWFQERIEDFDLWLVCNGRAELQDENGEKTVLVRGSVVWLCPGMKFQLRADAEGSYTNIFIHFDFVDRRGRVIPPAEVIIPPPTGFVHDIHYFEATLRRIMFLQYQIKQATDPAAAETLRVQVSHLLKGLLYDYELGCRNPQVAGSAGIGQHHAQVISSALSWLYLHPGSHLSASELAQRFGYSQRHFCRIFHMVTGKTPAQVLIEARIDHAKRLLASSALNVSEIADSLRYKNVFYFSRQFKQAVGASPAEYRRSLSARISP